MLRKTSKLIKVQDAISNVLPFEEKQGNATSAKPEKVAKYAKEPERAEEPRIKYEPETDPEMDIEIQNFDDDFIPSMTQAFAYYNNHTRNW